MVREGCYIAVVPSNERIKKLVSITFVVVNDPYRSYLQDIDDERITGFRSLDSDGPREVVDLGEVEVLDIVGVVRVQYLHELGIAPMMSNRVRQSYPEQESSLCETVRPQLTCPPVHSAHSIRKT
jgi:hypothetical protein